MPLEVVNVTKKAFEMLAKIVARQFDWANSLVRYHVTVMTCRQVILRHEQIHRYDGIK